MSLDKTFDAGLTVAVIAIVLSLIFFDLPLRQTPSKVSQRGFRRTALGARRAR